MSITPTHPSEPSKASLELAKRAAETLFNYDTSMPTVIADEVIPLALLIEAYAEQVAGEPYRVQLFNQATEINSLRTKYAALVKAGEAFLRWACPRIDENCKHFAPPVSAFIAALRPESAPTVPPTEQQEGE